MCLTSGSIVVIIRGIVLLFREIESGRGHCKRTSSSPRLDHSSYFRRPSCGTTRQLGLNRCVLEDTWWSHRGIRKETPFTLIHNGGRTRTGPVPAASPQLHTMVNARRNTGSISKQTSASSLLQKAQPTTITLPDLGSPTESTICAAGSHLTRTICTVKAIFQFASAEGGITTRGRAPQTHIS